MALTIRERLLLKKEVVISAYSKSFRFGTQQLPFTMSPLTIESARVVYERTVVPRTGYNRFQKPILRTLCEEKRIHVRSTAVRSSNPTKDDYIRALLDHVSAHEQGGRTSRGGRRHYCGGEVTAWRHRTSSESTRNTRRNGH